MKCYDCGSLVAKEHSHLSGFIGWQRILVKHYKKWVEEVGVCTILEDNSIKISEDTNTYMRIPSGSWKVINN